jgi:hypothetical protein
MRRLALIVTTLALAACAKKDAPPADVTAPPAPAAINLASVAGMWAFHTMGADNDSVLTTSTIAATADTAGWVQTLKDRKPMTLKVWVSGDSIMTASPEYESVLRAGVKVTTNSVFHLVGDTLKGTTTAHYNVKGPDSVRMLRTVGTKMPM